MQREARVGLDLGLDLGLELGLELKLRRWLRLGTLAAIGMLAIGVGSGCEGRLNSTGGHVTPWGDAGRTPPGIDAGGPPPGVDAGPPPPMVDAGGPPPMVDAGGPPPMPDAGPLDPCDMITCGTGEQCVDGSCICLPGFLLQGGVCVPIAPGDPAGRTMAEVCTAWTEGHVQNASPAWNMGASMCDEGSLSPEAIADTVRRANLFRWLAGLGPVMDDPSQQAGNQKCALMMSVNGALSHSPPTTWDCYTAEGAAAAGRSNIALGVSSSPAAINLYMSDRGVSSLGHRRWILNFTLGRIGIGFAGRGQCLGVFSGGGSTTRTWTAYPNEGPAPVQLAGNTWSFHSTASLGSANVTVQASDGTDLPVTVSHPPNGYGPNTVAWDPSGWTPTAGESYTVTVTDFTGGPISYTVQLVDC